MDNIGRGRGQGTISGSLVFSAGLCLASSLCALALSHVVLSMRPQSLIYVSLMTQYTSRILPCGRCSGRLQQLIHDYMRGTMGTLKGIVAYAYYQIEGQVRKWAKLVTSCVLINYEMGLKKSHKKSMYLPSDVYFYQNQKLLIYSYTWIVSTFKL